MSLTSSVDAILSKVCASGDVPGVVAMACDRNGSLYEGAFGVRERGKPQPMAVDTVMWIASMTKALTGAAAMQLVEQGKLDLDKPGGSWMPELAEVQVLEGFDDAGKPKLRPPKAPVTLRQLLTHTAGYGYDTWNPEIGRYQQVTGLPPIRTRENAALRAPLLFDPGTRWNYGISIDFAGRLVEIASGQRLGAYLRDHVTGPLGMHDTDFALTDAMRGRAASVHQRGKTGELKPIVMPPPAKPDFEMGGGGLNSTAPDYLRFVRAILNGGALDGQRILKPETVALMSRNHMGALRVTPMRTTLPNLSLDAEFFPGIPKGWGLTFQINEETAPTGRSAGSLSWAGLGNTYYWIDPVKGIGGVLATQILPFADSKALPLLYAFETEVYRSLA
jgi:methyl acetate hydrolase